MALLLPLYQLLDRYFIILFHNYGYYEQERKKYHKQGSQKL